MEHCLEEQQRIWPKGMPRGYAGTSCNGCGKANKITQRRGPTDWCDVAAGGGAAREPVAPQAAGRFRGIHQLFAMDQHLVSQRFLLRRVVVDPLRPGTTFPGQLNTEAFRDACEEYKVVSRPLNESATAYYMCALQPADLPHAAPRRHSFLRPARAGGVHERLQTSGRHTVRPQGCYELVAGLQYTGIVFMTSP